MPCEGIERHGGADADAVECLGDFTERWNRLEIDQPRRTDEIAVEEVEQIGPTGQDGGVAVVPSLLAMLKTPLPAKT